MTNQYTDHGPDVNPLQLVDTDRLEAALFEVSEILAESDKYMSKLANINSSYSMFSDKSGNEDSNALKELMDVTSDLAKQLSTKEFGHLDDHTQTPKSITS